MQNQITWIEEKPAGIELKGEVIPKIGNEDSLILEFYIYKEKEKSDYKVQARIWGHFVLISRIEPENNFKSIDDAKAYCERIYADYLERITPKEKPKMILGGGFIGITEPKVYKNPTCRGCKALGNNCGVCEKCREEE